MRAASLKIRMGVHVRIVPVLAAVLLWVSPLWGQRVSISLHDDLSVQAVRVIPQYAGYVLITGEQQFPLEFGATLDARREGEAVSLELNGTPLGVFAHAALVNMDPEARFSLELTSPAGKTQVYDGNLSLYVDFGRLMTNNLVDQELYVAGVALAEIGGYAELEMYKAQILLIRTYLLANGSRHITEGYNLCDQTHCQAYQGSAFRYPKIGQAAKATQGLVLVDRSGRLINSVFHANCGGETASAGDVWLVHNDYLRARRDPYCRRSRGAVWRATVPLEKWKHFLQSKGVRTAQIGKGGYNFRSDRREALYTLSGGVAVPFRDLREYFKLKSAWFDVRVVGDKVQLEGRGYGHGIGLCQEGAMRMAVEGKTVEEIVAFYLSGVRVVPKEKAIVEEEQ